MLDAALELLAEDGVAVSLDGLQLEDVIRRADVSRTSAYRRWPTREAFLEDVLVELARGAELGHIGIRVAAEGAELLAGYRDALATAEGRRTLFVELLRLSFQTDLEVTLRSPQFRTYLALRAAFVGVPSDELRGRLAAALARTEGRSVARGSVILVGACRLLGFRLTGPLVDGPADAAVVGRAADDVAVDGSGNDGTDSGGEPDGDRSGGRDADAAGDLAVAATLARAIAATTTGFVIAALADPGVLERTRELAPFGSTAPAPWSVPALTLAGIVLANVEQDLDAPTPDVDALAVALSELVAAGAAAAASAGLAASPATPPTQASGTMGG